MFVAKMKLVEDGKATTSTGSKKKKKDVWRLRVQRRRKMRIWNQHQLKETCSMERFPTRIYQSKRFLFSYVC